MLRLYSILLILVLALTSSTLARAQPSPAALTSSTLAISQPSPAADPSMGGLGPAPTPVSPSPAVTPLPETADPTAVIGLALAALEAAQDGRWAIAIGLALMVVTFLAVRIPQVRARVPKDYTATFLLGTALLGSFGASLASGAPPGKAAFTALVCSSMAIAFWESAGKHLLKLWEKLTSPAVGGGA